MDSLDSADAQGLDTVLSLIESSLPTESLFYDFANNEDKVTLPTLQDDAFNNAAKTFFSSLKQSGQNDETILSIMRSAEPFQSQWQETLDALGIQEQ